MASLSDAEANDQLQDGDLDVDRARAPAVIKLARTEAGTVSNCAFSMQFQTSSSLDRIEGLFPDPRLATGLPAGTRNKIISTVMILLTSVADRVSDPH
jgi:hypothetical protein